MSRKSLTKKYAMPDHLSDRYANHYDIALLWVITQGAKLTIHQCQAFMRGWHADSAWRSALEGLLLHGKLTYDSDLINPTVEITASGMEMLIYQDKILAWPRA